MKEVKVGIVGLGRLGSVHAQNPRLQADRGLLAR